jgi:plastocyanin
MTRLLLVLTFLLAACASADSTDVSQTWVVEIRGMQFHPQRLNIRPGDEVTFVNHDFVAHTATAATVSGSIAWSSRELKQSESQTLKFDTDRDAAYYCKLHPNMKASIVMD